MTQALETRLASQPEARLPQTLNQPWLIARPAAAAQSLLTVSDCPVTLTNVTSCWTIAVGWWWRAACYPEQELFSDSCYSSLLAEALVWHSL